MRLEAESSAVFSPDRRYRYSLTRRWAEGPEICFVLLNPSVADETRDDHTLRCCRRFAQDWGYAALIVVNLFALVTTDPRALMRAHDPIGAENDRHIERAHRHAERTVAGWGAHPAIRGRDRAVLRMLDGAADYIALTKGGAPRHPSRLGRSLVPHAWESRSVLA